MIFGFERPVGLADGNEVGTGRFDQTPDEWLRRSPADAPGSHVR